MSSYPHPASTFLHKQYGLLTITEDLGIENSVRRVLAKCKCGASKIFRLKDIKSGGSISCGCVKKERISNLKKTHNLVHDPLYSVWRGIIDRCYNVNASRFSDYGGKGVVMCEEWRSDFYSFHCWATSNGWAKGLVVDKDKRAFPNVGKEYSPKFCSILTAKENMNYRSSSKMLEYKGLVKSLSLWADDLGLNYQAVKDRINVLHWTTEKAFETPIRKIKK